MKLLLDNNLPLRLLSELASTYPGSIHVKQVQLDSASDEDIWQYAKANNLTIVSKDRDFADLAVLRGQPPKSIWLRVGNCSTQEVLRSITLAAALIEDFILDKELALLVIPQIVSV